MWNKLNVVRFFTTLLLHIETVVPGELPLSTNSPVCLVLH